jgi:hypothetical protein
VEAFVLFHFVVFFPSVRCSQLHLNVKFKKFHLRIVLIICIIPYPRIPAPFIPTPSPPAPRQLLSMTPLLWMCHILLRHYLISPLWMCRLPLPTIYDTLPTSTLFHMDDTSPNLPAMVLIILCKLGPRQALSILKHFLTTSYITPPSILYKLYTWWYRYLLLLVTLRQ